VQSIHIGDAPAALPGSLRPLGPSASAGLDLRLLCQATAVLLAVPVVGHSGGVGRAVVGWIPPSSYVRDLE
jgi:hypothetical protein